MKQSLRFLFKPWTFFNQLQWSSHHWVLMAAFLGLALVESQVGRTQALYNEYAQIVQHRMGLTFSSALWVVTFARLGLMLLGTSVLAWTLWIGGMLFGAHSSRRVLARRLSVVLTVLLAGYTTSHFVPVQPELEVLSLALYLWAATLGYFALREQFGLGHLETAILAVFAVLALNVSWNHSNRVLGETARAQLVELARTQAPNGAAHSVSPRAFRR